MDVELKYVFYLDINIMFDMFLFEFEVFINFDQQKKMEFVVCFVVDDKEYWDNNEGKNYKIFFVDVKLLDYVEEVVKSVCDIFKLKNVELWIQFVFWNKVDIFVLYWQFWWLIFQVLFQIL